MLKLKFAIPLCLCAAFLASATHAEDFEAQIKARQSWMKMMGYNAGILGAMTRGKMDYDADLAATTAKNMSLAAQMNNASMWPQGSDMDAQFDTVAKVALWQNFDKAGGYLNDLASATAVLAKEAGNGEDALKAAMSDVGKTCSGCHRQFRAKK